MDDNFFKDLLNISLDEEMYQRLVEEVRNDPDMEINFQPEYSGLEGLALIGQYLLRQRQYENIIQGEQPSTSSQSSELSRTVEASSQNQQPEDSFRSRFIEIILAAPRPLPRESSQSTQPSTNLRSSELTGTTVVFSQNQDPSQRSPTYDMHKIPRLHAEEAAIIPSQEVSSSEAVIDKDFATAASKDQVEDQSHQQKDFPCVSPFPIPLPHTSLPIPNPPVRMMPQEQEPSAKNDPDNRRKVAKPKQIINLAEMEELIATFRRAREILGFTQEEVNPVLDGLSEKRISNNALTSFERLGTIFRNMCRLTLQIERVLKDMRTSRTTSPSLMEASESIVPGLPTETCTTQEQDLGNVFLQNAMPEAQGFATENLSMPSFQDICGAVSNDSPENSTGAASDDRITPGIDTPENIHRVIQLSQLEETMTVEELLQSIEIQCSRRRDLNLRQIEVKSELVRQNVRVTNFKYFETFDDFIDDMFYLKRAMEEWLKDIHFSETQVKMSSRTRATLQAFFELNGRPTAQDISWLAPRVNLDSELVAIWFQKYLQIKKCTKAPTDSTAAKFPARHPHQKPQQ